MGLKRHLSDFLTPSPIVEEQPSSVRKNIVMCCSSLHENEKGSDKSKRVTKPRETFSQVPPPDGVFLMRVSVLIKSVGFPLNTYLLLQHKNYLSYVLII